MTDLNGPEFAEPSLGQISVRCVNGVVYVEGALLFQESLDVLVRELEKHRNKLPTANPIE